MIGHRPALRGVAAIACIVGAILVWEGVETIVLQSGDGPDGGWRRAGQVHMQPVGSKSGETNASVPVEPVKDDNQGEPDGVVRDTVESSILSRQCLVGAFMHGMPENNVYTQRGEDGILDKIWECVTPVSKTYVELGVEDGSSYVSRHLREEGWTGLMVGRGNANVELDLKTETPTADNIIGILQKHSTPMQFDLLAVHIDINTFWVLQAVLQGGYQPRAIVAAINRNFHPTDTFVVPHGANKQPDGTTYFGAAAGAFDALFEQVGYRTVTIDPSQGSVFAVTAAAVGQPRLKSMDEIAAGLTTVPLCQAAGTCTGGGQWLEVDGNAAPKLGMPRSDWYDALPRWTVRCMPLIRAVGSDQMQVGVPDGTRELPEYHPGVLSLVPCGRVADNTALADAIVAAQAPPPHMGGGDAAGNGTVECRAQSDVVAKQRECILAAFATGSTPQETRRYSQYNEDGIIDGIFSCIKPYDRYYVEFGVEDGTECTTRHLREDGWTGLMMDGGNFRPEINLQQEFFNAEGIAWQFGKYAVPWRFDHLTIDIDQNTFWVLHAILIAGFRPRVIVAEINRNFHFNDTFVVPYDYHQMWVHTSMVFGAGPGALDLLFEAFGYHTVAMDQDQVNIFAVHSCEVGEERLFSSEELVAGLVRVGPCAGIHTCGEGEFLEITEDVAPLLTRPHYEWIGKLKRWWTACSDPAMQRDAQPVRMITGKPIGADGTVPSVPRFPQEAVTKEQCATVVDATIAAEALANP